MSKKKLLLLGILAFLGTFILVTWVMKGTEQTKVILGGVWAWFLALPQTIVNFIQSATSTTTGSIGTVTAAVGGVGTAVTLASKLRSTTKQATESIGQVSDQLSSTRSQLTQARTDLESLRSQSKETIDKLQTEKLDLQNQLATANEKAATAERQIQKGIDERNAADRIAAHTTALLSKCKYCGQNVFPEQTFCQYCGKELLAR